MMPNEYNKGVAFICEGDTEKEFYLSLLNYFCTKYSKELKKTINDQETDIIYELIGRGEKSIIKFHIAGSITGMPRTSNWFEVQCVKNCGSKTPWHVFLCYDTDSYTDCITPFYKGDWIDLRNKLKKAKSIIDLAAAADIEDIMLVDIVGVCSFIGHTIVSAESIPGRKGAAKMKKIYRDCGRSYHKGERAREMIDSLNKQLIVDSNIIELKKIEELLFM